MPKLNPGGDAAPAGRHGRGRRVSSSLSEINVVPLVDVMLVLLIIFMVTAPMIQRGVDVNLPRAANSNQIIGERLEVTVPATYRQNHMVYLGTEPIRVDVLQERVRQKMEHANPKDVYLRGDGEVRLQDLSEIFGRLMGGGVEHVAIVTKDVGDR
jgi:biopolymer transport protein TolR